MKAGLLLLLLALWLAAGPGCARTRLHAEGTPGHVDWRIGLIF